MDKEVRSGPLQGSIIVNKFGSDLRDALLNELLEYEGKIDETEHDLDAYFAKYHEQCSHALVDHGRLCHARIHQDLVDIAQLIKASQPYELILASLQRKYAHRATPVQTEMLERSIELTARLLCMHDVGKWQYSASGRGTLPWTSGTLHEGLAAFYGISVTSGDSGKLESSFGVTAIEKLADIRIVWTDNLAEHLRLCDGRTGDRELSIFHHATFLKLMSGDPQQTIFPEEFIDETLATLRLLFPHRDRAVRTWFAKKQAIEERPLDRALLSCGTLSPSDRHLEHFSFWRERLSILKQAFDESEPGTLTQWWNDRRKRVQWSTFWVAVLVLILTIVFGLIQSIEGALQVYKAYNPSV